MLFPSVLSQKRSYINVRFLSMMYILMFIYGSHIETNGTVNRPGLYRVLCSCKVLAVHV